MSIEYDLYLTQHIENVQKAWDWMKTNLLTNPNFRDELEKIYPEHDIGFIDIFKVNELVEQHDRSKYESCEYRPYDAYFYGPPSIRRSYETVNNFNEAFLKHIHKNPHHWQYWVLVHDDVNEPTEALEMPVVYIFEMLCDWWSFSLKKEKPLEIFEWWDKHKNHILFAKKTKKTVDYILGEMQKVLYGEEYNKAFEETKEHLVHADEEDEDKHKYGVPEQKKFPLPDADHVHSAIKFFNYVDPEYEKELAQAILKRAKEYGVDISEINVGDENRFKKYLKGEKE